MVSVPTHQQVQVGNVCLDVVAVVSFDLGEVLEEGRGLGAQHRYVGTHPAHAGRHAFPCQAWWTHRLVDQNRTRAKASTRIRTWTHL